jgi:hypothetical protein
MNRIAPLERGETHINRKGPIRLFSDQEVWEIRRRRLEGATIKTLCEEFGGTSPTIADAIYGLGTYRDV